MMLKDLLPFHSALRTGTRQMIYSGWKILMSVFFCQWNFTVCIRCVHSVFSSPVKRWKQRVILIFLTPKPERPANCFLCISKDIFTDVAQNTINIRHRIRVIRMNIWRCVLCGIILFQRLYDIFRHLTLLLQIIAVYNVKPLMDRRYFPLLQRTLYFFY